MPVRFATAYGEGEANGLNFQLLVGPGDLPVSPDRIIRVPLTEEIRVPITQEGLTQVLFEESDPCGE